MKFLLFWLLLAGCVAPQLIHNCPIPCESGQRCDASVGECKDDPCGGKCTGSLRCRPGPPPHCAELGVGEANVAAPGEPTGAAEPPSTPSSPPAP
jgi:hypothetical protein